MEYYAATRKDEVMPFKTTWMDLEGIMLSEISLTEKDKYYDFTHKLNLKKKKQKQKQTNKTK